MTHFTNSAKIVPMEPYGYYPIYTKTVDHLDEVNPDALFANGLEAACIGHAEIWNDLGQRVSLAVYSKQKVIGHLVENENILFSDAEEYAEFNIYNAYMGPNTPIFVDEIYSLTPARHLKLVVPEDIYEI